MVEGEEIINGSDLVASRESILAIEKMLKTDINAKEGISDAGVWNHTFAEGVYLREMQLPKGSWIVGEIQKFDHIIILLRGVIDVATDFGVTRITAPTYFVAPKGTKRAAVVIEDISWLNCHPNPTNTQDLDKIEKYVISKSFKDFDEFQNKLEMKKMKKLNNKGVLV